MRKTLVILFSTLLLSSLSFAEDVKITCVDEEVGIDFRYDSSVSDEVVNGSFENLFETRAFLYNEKESSETDLVFIETEANTPKWKVIIQPALGVMELVSMDPADPLTWISGCEMEAI